MSQKLSPEERKFIRDFEANKLVAGTFHHRDHVRLVWLYLQVLPIDEVLERFAKGLRQFARAQGKEKLYHETITWSFIFIIRERMEGTNAANWQEFEARNPDLFDWKNSILKKYYTDEKLDSSLARKQFVMPDRIRGELHGN